MKHRESGLLYCSDDLDVIVNDNVDGMLGGQLPEQLDLCDPSRAKVTAATHEQATVRKSMSLKPQLRHSAELDRAAREVDNWVLRGQ
jgi:hypothetical protein